MDTASAPPEPQNPSAVVAAEADSTTSASTTTTPSADAATASFAPAADAEPVKEADDDEDGFERLANVEELLTAARQHDETFAAGQAGSDGEADAPR